MKKKQYMKTMISFYYHFNNKFSFSKGKKIKNNENEKSEILFKIPGAITLEGYNMEHIGINVG